jgi:hypothetical protein
MGQFLWSGQPVHDGGAFSWQATWRVSARTPVLGIIGGVANRAYFSLWLQDNSEATMLESFRLFLGTAPFSSPTPAPAHLIIRAVNPAQPPLVEAGLEGTETDAAATQLIAEHLHSDCSYELESWWDLWTCASENGTWELHPQPLLIFCRGENYDDGRAQAEGQIEIDLGFEHFFTGRAEVLNAGTIMAAPENPAQAAYVTVMSQDQERDVYHEKTTDNIRRLLEWVQRARAMPKVGRIRLWSEGEENFEARMDQILAWR